MAVPYAPIRFEMGGAFIDCPFCTARIRLRTKLDFETIDRRPYAEHVLDKHPEREVKL